MIYTVKKKGKRRKLKDNSPKNDVATSCETVNVPKSDVKVETTSTDTDGYVLENQSDNRNDNQDINLNQETIEPEPSSIVKQEMASPPMERKATSYINVSIYCL